MFDKARLRDKTRTAEQLSALRAVDQSTLPTKYPAYNKPRCDWLPYFGPDGLREPCIPKNWRDGMPASEPDPPRLAVEIFMEFTEAVLLD